MIGFRGIQKLIQLAHDLSYEKLKLRYATPYGLILADGPFLVHGLILTNGLLLTYGLIISPQGSGYT